MEASDDQVQLWGGNEFGGGGQSWIPSGAEVWGRRACKLANPASQTQTLRLQVQRERPHPKGGEALCRVHWNIQVFLHCWVSVSKPELLGARVCQRLAQINGSPAFLSCLLILIWHWLWPFFHFPILHSFLHSNKFSLSSRCKPCVLDQQHIPAGGEKRGWGLLAALPADWTSSHGSWAANGQWHDCATRDELHGLSAPGYPHPQPPSKLQCWLCVHCQGQRGGEDLQDLFH